MKESALQLFTQSRMARFLAAWLLAVALASTPAHAADLNEGTIRAGTNEVRIAFAASDGEGHVVKSLRSSDVAVADNGLIVRQFRSFRPAMESPLDVVLLLDASGSETPHLAEEIATAKSFLANSAWDQRDRVSIVAFGGLQTQALCVRNCRGADAQSKLNALRTDGLTPLYDAVVKASEILQENRDPESRPAMILFSDGFDTVSVHSISDALQAAQNLQSAIYSVNSRPKKTVADHGDEVLEYLSGSTGGLSFPPGQETPEVLRMVLADLRSGYVLTYELPEQNGGQHSVRLLPTRDATLQLRSRRSYDEASDE
jgi:VWFA-related protein